MVQVYFNVQQHNRSMIVGVFCLNLPPSAGSLLKNG